MRQNQKNFIPTKVPRGNQEVTKKNEKNFDNIYRPGVGSHTRSHVRLSMQ